MLCTGVDPGLGVNNAVGTKVADLGEHSSQESIARLIAIDFLQSSFSIQTSKLY